MLKMFNIKTIIKTNTCNCFVDLFLFHTPLRPSEFVGLARPLCCVLEKSFTLTVALHPGAVTCSALLCLPPCAALGSLLCSQRIHCGFLKAFARSALYRAFLLCSHGYSPGVPLLSPVHFYTQGRCFPQRVTPWIPNRVCFGLAQAFARPLRCVLFCISAFCHAFLALSPL